MSEMPIWYVYVPGFLIVIAGVVIFRWLVYLSKRVNDLADRVAHLEGRLDRGQS